MKRGKKLICMLLCLCIFAGIFSACAEEKQPEVPPGDGYEKLTQVFSGNAAALEMLQTVDSCLSGIAKASVEKYTEALITAMVTYDMQHALQVAEQYQTENLQVAKQNKLEFDATKEAVYAVMMDMDDSTAIFKKELTTLPGKTEFEEWPIEWIYGVSEIETILQHYSLYHSFLKNIAENTTSNLQKAAQNAQNTIAYIAESRDLSGDTATGFGWTSAFLFESYPLSQLSQDEQHGTLVNFVLSLLSSTPPTEAVPASGEETWKKAYLDWIYTQNGK